MPPENQFNVFMKDYQHEDPVRYLTAAELQPWTEIRPRSREGIRKLKRLIIKGG
jgi:hypothetical protein